MGLEMAGRDDWEDTVLKEGRGKTRSGPGLLFHDAMGTLDISGTRCCLFGCLDASDVEIPGIDLAGREMKRDQAIESGY